MKVTAITKFKHGALLDALRRHNLGPCSFAERFGISKTLMCRCVNLVQRPRIDIAAKILAGLAELGEVFSFEELWPDEFKPTGQALTLEQSREIEPQFIGHYLEYERDRLLTNGSHVKLPEDVQTAIDSLRKRDRMVLDMYAKGMTFSEMEKKLGVSRGRARQRVVESVRKVRRRMNTQKALEGTPVITDYQLLETLGGE